MAFIPSQMAFLTFGLYTQKLDHISNKVDEAPADPAVRRKQGKVGRALLTGPPVRRKKGKLRRAVARPAVRRKKGNCTSRIMRYVL